MKYLTFIALATTLILFGCAKPKSIAINRYVDIPFETILSQPNNLVDSANSKVFEFTVVRIIDNRSMGIECQSSTGGNAKIITLIKAGAQTRSDTLIMKGCTAGNEWDPANLNIPKIRFSGYKICLLKLNPYNAIVKENEYQVKYVIKKN
ncbi:MAG: hypothetical protein U0T73_00015 [Chitinophagales bacterium]